MPRTSMSTERRNREKRSPGIPGNWMWIAYTSMCTHPFRMTGIHNSLIN